MRAIILELLFSVKMINRCQGGQATLKYLDDTRVISQKKKNATSFGKCCQMFESFQAEDWKLGLTLQMKALKSFETSLVI